MLHLNGSYGEGGGQILRTALSLAAILQQPFRITEIRRRRKRPGLLPQHLTGVNAAAEICGAKVSGNQLNSTELAFEPGPIRSGSYRFDVAEETGSAGSVTLVIQTILPILFWASERFQVKILGGTHVPFSPCYDYLERVLIPFLRRLGFHLESEIHRYGFFPVGRGEVRLETEPVPKEALAGITLTERGELRQTRLVSAVARLPESIAERQRNRFLTCLGHRDPTIQLRTVPAQSPGTYVFFECQYENVAVGFTGLGARGKPAEKVAEEAYLEFDQYRQGHGVLDPHLADQVLLFLVLAGKPSAFTTSAVTNHLLTNLWVIEQFLPQVDIRVQGEIGKPGIVSFA
jgi:RNA 3'-terminal phosphate cyclase (ATP)